ncbi:MAG: hypothetical protein AB9869_18875 [Verrucomicrobiia bacterium]
MIPNPIRKVLSTIQTQQVRALLMGGQACVLYGAAQFSRDLDLAILAEAGNLERLRQALASLRAENVAVPPFRIDYLQRGHAVHFRCRHPEAAGIRLDIMSKMRGVDDFQVVWARRTELADPSGLTWQLLSLPDLVQAKKTQRDKDWPMIRALLEAHYFAQRGSTDQQALEFWLRELRTPKILLELAVRHRAVAEQMTSDRPLLSLALVGDAANLSRALHEEEMRERQADEVYWRPLRAELERLRHARLQ